VEIFDQAYNLRGTDPDYIIRLAEYVDAKMRAVSEQTNTVDSLRVAVLAALNIADEYHMLKRKQEGSGSDYAQRAQRLSRILDDVLEDTRRAG
jgi:cell division protein ZapA